MGNKGVGRKPLILIAAGGTGGHMFPAQALAEEMLHRGWRVVLSTDLRGARYAGDFSSDVLVEKVPSATFARGGLLAKASVPFFLTAGILIAFMRQLLHRPTTVVGFGGYPTVPAMAAAWILRCPRMLHEQNGVLGRVNRFFAPRVHHLACGTWPTSLLPKGVVSSYTGNPVRTSVLARAASPYIPPGDYPMSLVVIGGSQGARVLSEVVPSAVAMLPLWIRCHLRVFHQARPEDLVKAQEIYDKSGVKAELRPFFDNIADCLSEAQLVISRAGASSIADITVVGRPAIFIPYAAAAGDHQTANVRSLEKAGGCFSIAESSATAERLRDTLYALITEKNMAKNMAMTALNHAKPDATLDLANGVKSLSA